MNKAVYLPASLPLAKPVYAKPVPVSTSHFLPSLRRFPFSGTTFLIAQTRQYFMNAFCRVAISSSNFYLFRQCNIERQNRKLFINVAVMSSIAEVHFMEGLGAKRKREGGGTSDSNHNGEMEDPPQDEGDDKGGPLPSILISAASSSSIPQRDEEGKGKGNEKVAVDQEERKRTRKDDGEEGEDGGASCVAEVNN
jgi:hypothetical protein